MQAFIDIFFGFAQIGLVFGVWYAVILLVGR